MWMACRAGPCEQRGWPPAPPLHPAPPLARPAPPPPRPAPPLRCPSPRLRPHPHLLQRQRGGVPHALEQRQPGQVAQQPLVALQRIRVARVLLQGRLLLLPVPQAALGEHQGQALQADTWARGLPASSSQQRRRALRAARTEGRLPGNPAPAPGGVAGRTRGRPGTLPATPEREGRGRDRTQCARDDHALFPDSLFQRSPGEKDGRLNRRDNRAGGAEGPAPHLHGQRPGGHLRGAQPPQEVVQHLTRRLLVCLGAQQQVLQAAQQLLLLLLPLWGRGLGVRRQGQGGRVGPGMGIWGSGGQGRCVRVVGSGRARGPQVFGVRGWGSGWACEGGRVREGVWAPHVWGQGMGVRAGVWAPGVWGQETGSGRARGPQVSGVGRQGQGGRVGPGAR